MTSRQTARDALREANHHAIDAQTGDYPATMALVGIGYALLDLGDAIREQNELIGSTLCNCVDVDDGKRIETIDTAGRT